MKVDIINDKGSKVGDATLADTVFGLDINEQPIFDSVINEQANDHIGTAFKKNRGLVQGSTKKPYRQKGTGWARQGSKRRPQFRGGGRAFGNQWNNYKYSLPQKMKAKALNIILSKKAADKKLKVIDNLSISEPKTKLLIQKLEKISLESTITLVIGSEDRNIKLAARNIPWLNLLNANRLNANDLFYTDEVVITKDALEVLNKRGNK